MRTMKRLLVGGMAGITALMGAPWGVAAAHAAAETPTFQRVEAESYSYQWGTRLSADGRLVTQFSPGDILRYDAVATRSANFTLLCFSTPATRQEALEVGTVEVRFDNLWSKPVMSIPLRNYVGGGLKQLANGAPVADGTRRVYLTIRQSWSSQPVSLDYILFSEYPPPPSQNC